MSSPKTYSEHKDNAKRLGISVSESQRRDEQAGLAVPYPKERPPTEADKELRELGLPAIKYDLWALRFGVSAQAIKRDLMCAAYNGEPQVLTKMQIAQIMGETLPSPRVMYIDIETTPWGDTIAAMCLDSNNALHYVGYSKGRMSSAQPNLQSLPKAQSVNKTIADIQAELDAAVAAKAEKDIIDQRAAELARYFRLHAATGAVLTDIRDKAITPRALVAEFRTELKALAAEFGYRIVLVGDRTAAVLVQQ